MLRTENRHFHIPTRTPFSRDANPVCICNQQRSNDTNTSRRLGPGCLPSVCSVGSRATWSLVVSQDGTSTGYSCQNRTATLETSTSRPRPPSQVLSGNLTSVHKNFFFFLVLVVAPKEAQSHTGLAATVHAGQGLQAEPQSM